MKRTFEIEWPDQFGDSWMNKDNLMLCLTKDKCVGEKVSLKVRDITDDKNIVEVSRPCLLGGHDC